MLLIVTGIVLGNFILNNGFDYLSVNCRLHRIQISGIEHNAQLV